MNKKNESGLFAEADALIRASKQMKTLERKLCWIVFSQLKFTENDNSNIVIFKKDELAKKLGLEINSSDRSVKIRAILNNLRRHSEIKFNGEDSENWDDFFLFIGSSGRGTERGTVSIEINPNAMPLLQGLTKNFKTFYLEDLLSFTSDETGNRAADLYQYLRLNCDTRKLCSHILSTRQLKELWKMPKSGKGSYMRKDGHFNRTNFEKKVLDPVCEQLKDCNMIILEKQENGKYYTKHKKKGYVSGYEFTFRINLNPGLIDKDNFKVIQDNPQVAREIEKIANDILNGRKAAKEKKKDNFKNFEEREYDCDELEKRFAKN